ncbi:hypothetical protein [Silvimonas iriomotensis]|uniref:hypothetical protein n=1 Tax=Silvimonas iriomotensis TaxID=449662 RepID=UPI0016652156|nr:hypothetical protein [Silvimonas iriomotensis]
MTRLQQPVNTSDAGGQPLDTVEAALDFVYEQFETHHAQIREVWADTYNALAQACDSGDDDQIEAARHKLLDAIHLTHMGSA